MMPAADVTPGSSSNESPDLGLLFHRLNNQLGIILANAELLEAKLKDEVSRARDSDRVRRPRRARHGARNPPQDPLNVSPGSAPTLASTFPRKPTHSDSKLSRANFDSCRPQLSKL